MDARYARLECAEDMNWPKFSSFFLLVTKNISSHFLHAR